jgi:hypothetical protein
MVMGSDLPNGRSEPSACLAAICLKSRDNRARPDTLLSYALR